MCPTRTTQAPFAIVSISEPPGSFPVLTDDASAVRAWILTTIFVMLFSGVNEFFGLRYVRSAF